MFNFSILRLASTMGIVFAAFMMPDDVHAGATAAEMAAKMRAGVKCPPPSQIKTPGANILGAGPGMSYDEAANTILCTDPMLVLRQNDQRGIRINTMGQKLRLAFDAVYAEREKTSEEILKEMQSRGQQSRTALLGLEPGQSHWFVSAIGTPSKEIVLHVSRRERFVSDKAPTMEAMESALLKKYGEPTTGRKGRGGSYDFINMSWIYTPDGQKMNKDTKLPLCANFSSSLDQGFQYTQGCGIVVAAEVRAQPTNSAIAEILQVSIVNHEAALRQIELTQAALSQGDVNRQSKELEEAKKRSSTPKL